MNSDIIIDVFGFLENYINFEIHRFYNKINKDFCYTDLNIKKEGNFINCKRIAIKVFSEDALKYIDKWNIRRAYCYVNKITSISDTIVKIKILSWI
jgi:hypothetical protein